MQTPGNTYEGRCTHCGNQRTVRVMLNQWPDGRWTMERLCVECEPTWGRNLLELGCTLTPAPRTGPQLQSQL